MQRTLSAAENNVQVAPPRVVNVPAATPTELFPSDVGTRTGEIVTRYVQNITGDDLYLSFGISKANGDPQCDDALMFHCVIADRQLFDCFPERTRVCCYSAGGGLVSTVIKVRL